MFIVIATDTATVKVMVLAAFVTHNSKHCGISSTFLKNCFLIIYVSNMYNPGQAGGADNLLQIKF